MLTPDQKQRLEIISNYFEYLRCLSDRYLLAKQLRESKNLIMSEIFHKISDIIKILRETYGCKTGTSGED